MATLKNFQAEIEQINARERAKRYPQGIRALPSDGQAGASSAPESDTTMYEPFDPSEQEERILVSHCLTIPDKHLIISFYRGCSLHTTMTRHGVHWRRS